MSSLEFLTDKPIYVLITEKYGLCPDCGISETTHSRKWQESVGITFWDTDCDPIADIISMATNGTF